MKCSFCSRNAIYFRKYEGHYFCEKHFTQTIEKKAKKTIGSNKLIKAGDKVAIAHSGGRDSSSLVYLLNKIFQKNKKVKLFVISLDEGIKGYRDKCLKKSESLCEELGIERYVFSFKEEFGFTIDQLARKLKSGYCGTCGILKRYLLNKKARELGATKLATGHNLDDECQSILMNMLKGDLLRLVRVGPMPKLANHPKFVPRIKPLVEVPEEEIKLFAKINQIPSCVKVCPYARDDKLRGEAERFLRRLEKNSPGIMYSLYQSALRIAPIIRRKFKREKIRNCKVCGEPTSREICKVCELLSELKRL